MPIFFLICLTFFSFKATSQIFEYQKANGTVEYSDQIPMDGSTSSIRPVTQKTKESTFFGNTSKLISNDKAEPKTATPADQ